MMSKTEAQSTTTRWPVTGLAQAAEIAIDRWGIPHITTESRDDLFLMQGFNAARDRLWQMDLWRKRGLGLLAADFGPGFLEQDRAARLCVYRGDMQAEWAAYGTPHARHIVEKFVAGVNAYLDLLDEMPELLPEEFRVLGSRPALWAAEDVVRIRSHAWIRNLTSEVVRSQVAALADLDTDLARRSLHPEGWQPHVPTFPDGAPMGAAPTAVLNVFKLATEPPAFSADRLAAGLDQSVDWLVVPQQGKAETDPGLQGSNNWAISGARTASGRPILANDPHRDHCLPGLRYAVHLRCPDLDIAGSGEPSVPGISLGHNGHVAFGLTVVPADQEDLYVYELHPEDNHAYRYGDAWESMREVRETVAVKGHADQTVRLWFTRHGPVLHIDPATRRAYALRTVWTEPGTSAYLNSLAFLDSRSLDDQMAALRHWGVPATNQVFADVHGNVAWLPSGKIPRRRNWDGLLPVPGDGRYEWDGFLTPEEMPRLINPEEGYVATANEMNLPSDYPIEERRISFEWAERSRAHRIRAVLDAQPEHTVADSMALQCDVVSEVAQRCMVLLPENILPQARTLWRGWDGVLRADSAAAALFEVWWSRHLKPAMLRRIGQSADVAALLAPGDNATLLSMLESASPELGGLEGCEALLRGTLEAAWQDCEKRLGWDVAQWAWGTLHHGYFTHPLSSLSPSCRDIGPVPVGGSGSTPMNNDYRTKDFRIMKGASLRLVMDVGGWDNSRIINGPGQSGDPASTHYDDHLQAWAKGDYVPFLYTREAIEPCIERRIVLTPRAEAAISKRETGLNPA